MLGVDDALDSSSGDDLGIGEESEQLFESHVFLKHLRKCFISIDDKSYSESSLLPDLRVFTRITPGSYLADGSKLDFKSILSKRIEVDSYEYVSLQKNKINNLRSPTKNIQRIDKVESKPKPFPLFNENDTVRNKEFLFEAKLKPTAQTTGFVSALSELMDLSIDKNEFISYARYEAHNQEQMKSLKIFLPMSECQKKDSIKINIFKTARISDLIGLICYKYTVEKKSPPLKFNSVKDYLLKIADDSGEIEMELSSLDPTNSVGKFGFTHLALIENNNNKIESGNSKIDEKIKVIIHFTDDSPSEELQYDSESTTLKTVYSDLCRIKINILCPSIKYRLECIDEPGVLADLKATLANFKKLEFYFYRENSVRESSSITKVEAMPDLLLNEINEVTQISTKNTEFNVVYLSKWAKVQFKIELSKENIELEEINQGIGSKPKNSNFYSLPMKNVVACEHVPVKNKSQIRIIIVEEESSGSISYKHLDFECNPKVAEVIKSKFTHLMSFVNSSYVNDYDSSQPTTKWSRKLYQMKTKSNKI